MSDESVTPGLVDLLRRADDAADRHDIDALMGFYAPDAVWDMSAVGIGGEHGRLVGSDKRVEHMRG